MAVGIDFQDWLSFVDPRMPAHEGPKLDVLDAGIYLNLPKPQDAIRRQFYLSTTGSVCAVAQGAPVRISDWGP